MKYLIVLTVGVCLLIASVPAMAGQTEDEAAVRKAVEKLVAAWNSKDAKAHAALQGDFRIGWQVSGKSTIAEREKSMTEQFNAQKNAKGKIVEEIGIVFVTPDVAIYKARGEATGMVGADGQTLPPRSVLMAWVMVNKDGKWLAAAFFERSIEN